MTIPTNKLTAMLEAATPGPWKADAHPGCRTIKGDKRGRSKQAHYRRFACTDGLANDGEDRANAALIAAAPGLAREVLDLRAALDAERAAHAETIRLVGEYADSIAKPATFTGTPSLPSRWNPERAKIADDLRSLCSMLGGSDV